MSIAAELLRFGLVGTVGFVVDGGLLSIFVAAGADPYFVRALSFPTAVGVTWWLNRQWTFLNAVRSRPARQFWKYFRVQVVGALANLIVYAGILASMEPDWQDALFAFAVGSIVGMAINFLGSKFLVYHESERVRPEQN